MKKLFLFLSASILMLMISCGDNVVKQDKNELQQSMSYIPLQVGNEWVYNRVFSTDTTQVFSKIIDSKIINNKVYYVVKFSTPDLFNWGINKLNTDSTALIRTTDGITYYRYWDGAEHLYRLFKDTTVTENEFTDIMIMYLDNEYRTHPFLGNDIQYIYAEVGGGTEPFLYDYAKGFGLVKFVWFKGYCELVYAKIEGKVYE